MAETIFGQTLTLSTGRIIPTRWVGEQHVKEDLGFIPSFADWVKAIRPEPWMGRSERIEAQVDPHLASPVVEVSSHDRSGLSAPRSARDGFALRRPARGSAGASPRHARRARLSDGAQALLPADALRACRAAGSRRQSDRLIASNQPFIPIQCPAPRPGFLNLRRSLWRITSPISHA